MTQLLAGFLFCWCLVFRNLQEVFQINQTATMERLLFCCGQAENDNLKTEMAWLKQKLFGSSSERRIDSYLGQMGLFDFEEEKPLELIEPEIVVCNVSISVDKDFVRYGMMSDNI